MATGELKSGDYGTQILTSGTATGPSNIDLSGVSENGDIAVLFCTWENTGGTSLSSDLFKNSGGTERWARATDISASTAGDYQTQAQTVVIRVGTPSATLWYGWSGVPTGSGLNVYVVMNIRGIPDN